MIGPTGTLMKERYGDNITLYPREDEQKLMKVKDQKKEEKKKSVKEKIKTPYPNTPDSELMDIFLIKNPTFFCPKE